jgi:ParB-like chromosome segregation protein Spo0J
VNPRPHPALALFPRMTRSEARGLEADIRRNGLREPIITANATLLDGRERLEACRRIGIDDPEPCELDADGRARRVRSAR